MSQVFTLDQRLSPEHSIHGAPFSSDLAGLADLAHLVIPKLVQSKASDDELRVWLIGYGTGEEAYMLASLCLAYAAQRVNPLSLRLFATERDDSVLRQAREGHCLADIAKLISAEQLATFFNRERGGYRVQTPLRDSVFFAQHDILKDPPFAKIDLIVCRQLSTRQEADAVARFFTICRYSLQPQGYLFLGTPVEAAEAAGFHPVKPEWGLYQRAMISPPSQVQPVQSVPGTLISYEALYQQALAPYTPPGLLVNAAYELVYCSAGVTPYLHQPSGLATNKVLKRIHPALHDALAVALEQALHKQEKTISPLIVLPTDSGAQTVQLWVEPSSIGEHEHFALVLFLKSDHTTQPPALHEATAATILAAAPEPSPAPRAAPDRPKAAVLADNEALIALSEELLHISTQWQTSRAELQAANEELLVIYQENQENVAKLRHLMTSLENLIVATDIATLFLDRDLRVQWFTPQMGKIFQLVRGAEGIALGYIFHQLHYADLVHDANQVLHTLTPHEQETRSATGQWYLLRILPYRTSEDYANGVVLTLLDITARKRAEDELRRVHELYRRSITAAEAVPYQRDYIANVYRFMGEAIQQITGYSAAEMTPTLFEAITLEMTPRGEAEGLSQAEAIRRNRHGAFQGWRADIRIRTATGEERWVADASVEMYDEQGTPSGSIGMLMDITERKQDEMSLQEGNHLLATTLAELKQVQQQLIQQERLRALGTMASGVAHDLNNLLAPIVGFTELLLLRPETQRKPEKTTYYLQAIHAAAQNAATVIKRLRDFYRNREDSETGQPVNLHQVIEQAMLLTQPHWKDQALARGVLIQIETQLQPVPMLEGNSAELQELLTNLLLNAVDALVTTGTITIRVFESKALPLRNTSDPARRHVILEVSDTGIGMEKETRQRCFEPFFSTKGKHGTGLGLAMVYGTVQRHQGRIEVESAPGAGTTFRIFLPIPMQTPVVHQAPIPSLRRSLQILVVDDDPVVRDLVVGYLQHAGHDATTAANGVEGLATARAQTFDLVLTDRAMPQLNGDGLAAALKAEMDIPVILLTGFGEFMKADGELPPGVDYVMSKPFTFNTLQQAIAHVIEA